MSSAVTTDIHFINAAMAAMNSADQPLTSLEFEAGTGDYSGGLDGLYDPSTVDLKTRLCVAQGNRMINYYLLAGGINPPLDRAVGDGNDRISFTGERHGTAAPIGAAVPCRSPVKLSRSLPSPTGLSSGGLIPPASR